MESRIYKILVHATGNTYTKAYPPSMKVGEILTEIQSQANLRNINIEVQLETGKAKLSLCKEYGLFVAPNVESGKKGFWLDKKAALRSYPLGEKVCQRLCTVPYK